MSVSHSREGKLLDHYFVINGEMCYLIIEVCMVVDSVLFCRAILPGPSEGSALAEYIIEASRIICY